MINISAKSAAQNQGDTAVTELKAGDTISAKHTGFSQEMTVHRVLHETPKMITFELIVEHGGYIKPGRIIRKAYRKTTTVNIME